VSCEVSSCEGEKLGAFLGVPDGFCKLEGAIDGKDEGPIDADFDGLIDGIIDGSIL